VRPALSFAAYLPQAFMTGVRAIGKQQIMQIGIEADVAEDRIGIGAFGKIVPDGLIPHLFGRLHFDGHAAIVHYDTCFAVS
jgi:hypothetical protein